MARGDRDFVFPRDRDSDKAPGRRLNSSSSRGCRSRQRSCSAMAGSGISVTCLSRSFRLAAVALAFNAFYYIISGQGTMILDDEEIELHTGVVVYVPRGVR